jgi:hypothetical protein
LKRAGQPTIETGRTTNKGVFFILVLSVLVFFAPILDQLIAYPKWQQLCKTTGDFEWGPGMDEKKAFGRGVIASTTTHEGTIFPKIHYLYFRQDFRDAETDELVLFMPHYEFTSANGIFQLPTAAGPSGAIFLNECSYFSESIVTNYLNQFNSKIVGYK